MLILIISAYTKGNFYGTIHFTDNSRFTVYAASTSEAEAVVNEVLTRVNSSFLDNPPRLSFGEKRGMPVGVHDMMPVSQAYFADGKQSSTPTWKRTFG